MFDPKKKVVNKQIHKRTKQEAGQTIILEAREKTLYTEQDTAKIIVASTYVKLEKLSQSQVIILEDGLNREIQKFKT